MLTMLILLPALQDDPIGEVPRPIFLAELSRFGYTAFGGKSPYEAILTSGADSVTITFSNGAAPLLHVAGLRADFDLPRYAEKARLRKWLDEQKLPGLKVFSYLGGKVVLTGQLADTKLSWDGVRANAERYFDGYRRLRQELSAMKGMQARRIGEMGKAPVDLSDRFDQIDEEDVKYLCAKLEWEAPPPPFVGGGHGWYVAAAPLGVPVIFNGMFSWHMLSLGAIAPHDPRKLDAWRRTAPKNFEVQVYDERVRVRATLDVSSGITVGKFVQWVEQFARAVKPLKPSLDL